MYSDVARRSKVTGSKPHETASCFGRPTPCLNQWWAWLSARMNSSLTFHAQRSLSFATQFAAPNVLLSLFGRLPFCLGMFRRLLRFLSEIMLRSIEGNTISGHKLKELHGIIYPHIITNFKGRCLSWSFYQPTNSSSGFWLKSWTSETSGHFKAVYVQNKQSQQKKSSLTCGMLPFKSESWQRKSRLIGGFNMFSTCFKQCLLSNLFGMLRFDMIWIFSSGFQQNHRKSRPCSLISRQWSPVLKPWRRKNGEGVFETLAVAVGRQGPEILISSMTV